MGGGKALTGNSTFRGGNHHFNIYSIILIYCFINYWRQVNYIKSVFTCWIFQILQVCKQNYSIKQISIFLKKNKAQSRVYLKSSLLQTRETQPIWRRVWICEGFLPLNQKEGNRHEEEKDQSGFHCEGKVVGQSRNTALLIWFRNGGLLLRSFLRPSFIVYLITPAVYGGIVWLHIN